MPSTTPWLLLCFGFRLARGGCTPKALAKALAKAHRKDKLLTLFQEVAKTEAEVQVRAAAEAEAKKKAEEEASAKAAAEAEAKEEEESELRRRWRSTGQYNQTKRSNYDGQHQ